MEKVEYMPVQYVDAAKGKQQQAVRYVQVPRGAKRCYYEANDAIRLMYVCCDSGTDADRCSKCHAQ